MKVRIVEGAKVDLEDIIRRSPAADEPDGLENFSEYLRASAAIYVCYADDEVACVCGLVPPTFLSENAYLWLLTTDLVDKNRFLFVRLSQVWLQEALEKYPTITGIAEVGNDKAIRWLKWLGAKFATPVGRLIPFVIRKSND